jgi:hypothetical protein
MKTTLTKLKEAKTIGYFAGVCFLFNAISGPAIPYTAANFQNPGMLFTLFSYALFTFLFTFLSGFANLFLIEAMQAVPGNKYFQGEIEFATLINFFFGPNLHVLGQGLLYAALQANSVQCLLLTAEVTDSLLVHSSFNS